MIRSLGIIVDIEMDAGRMSRSISFAPSEESIQNALDLAKYEGKDCDSTHLFRVLFSEFLLQKNLSSLTSNIIESMDKTPLIHPTQFPESHPPDTDPSPSYHGPETVDSVDYDEDGEP